MTATQESWKPTAISAPTDADSTSASRQPPTVAPRAPLHRRATLIIVSLTQLLVVLDGTIVGVALPSAQAALGMSDVSRQWVVTAYALTFGSLLLLGGRIADFFGRKKTFLIGVVGFGAASAWGGLADSGAVLLAARAGQGMFAALMAPAALAILTVTFPSGRARNTAFAVFGSVAGAGAAVGLLLGGALTEYLDWRWCLLVNLPFVVAGVAAGLPLLVESRADGDRRFDLVGAATVTGGFGALVIGLSLLEDPSRRPLGAVGMALGVLLLVAFVLVERRSSHPLLPLRIITDRIRGSALLIQAICGAVMMGAMLYLTFHLQQVLQLRPIQAGLGTLPITASLMATVPFATRLLNRLGPRRQLIAGPLVAAAGVASLGVRITVDGSYWTHVLPGLVLLGVGMGLTVVPLQNLALLGVANHDAGAAAAAATATNQIGGSIGLSALTLLYLTVAGQHGAAPDPAVLVHGYRWVFATASLLLVTAAVVAVMLVRPKPGQLSSAAPLPVAH